MWFQHGDPKSSAYLGARRKDLVQPKTRLALLELRAGLRSDALCQTHAHRQILSIYNINMQTYNYINIVILTVFYICDTKDDDL